MVRFDIYVYIPFLSSLQIVKDTCVYVYIYVVHNNISWYIYTPFLPSTNRLFSRPSMYDFYMGRKIRVYMYIYIYMYILLSFPHKSIIFSSIDVRFLYGSKDVYVVHNNDVMVRFDIYIYMYVCTCV